MSFRWKSWTIWNLKLEYDSIYVVQGAIVRSKAIWYEKGEKSNKYFLNLESHKKAKSSVRKVLNKDGVLEPIQRKYCTKLKSFTRTFIKLTR